MNTKLPDGTAVKCKRRGLKIVLSVGDKKGEGLMRRLDVSRDPVVMLDAALQEAAKSAGVQLTIEEGASLSSALKGGWGRTKVSPAAGLNGMVSKLNRLQARHKQMDRQQGRQIGRSSRGKDCYVVAGHSCNDVPTLICSKNPPIAPAKVPIQRSNRLPAAGTCRKSV